MKNSTDLPVITLHAPEGWSDYQLLDSGDGKILERFGPYTLIRPKPQAIWSKSLPQEAWQKAHATLQEGNNEYGGQWKLLKPMEKSWEMTYKTLRFQLQLSSSRHIGVFPEQASHWDWLTQRIETGRKPMKVLNLFGYSGLATLAAAKAGAEVTHVDASKHALTWASYNLKLSGLADKPVRWIAEDALKFVKREVRRGSTYDGLIMDPPKFGRGSSGEVWDFFKKMPELLEASRSLLSKDPSFIILTAYAIQASAVITAQAVQEIVGNTGNLVCGELVLVEESAGHILSQALFSRWTSEK
ncbi:MAG: class I SAM-dependent methyltransferase [Anaerolineaceae bacterium]